MGLAKSEECKGGVHNQDVPLYSNYKTDFSRRAMLLNAQTSANSCRYVESNFRLVVHTAPGRIVSRPAKFCHKPFWRRHHSFVCLFVWLVGSATHEKELGDHDFCLSRSQTSQQCQFFRQNDPVLSRFPKVRYTHLRDRP